MAKPKPTHEEFYPRSISVPEIPLDIRKGATRDRTAIVRFLSRLPSKITTRAEAEQAARLLSERIKPAIAFIQDNLKPNKKSWDEGHKQLVGIERDMIQPFVEAESQVKALIGDWLDRQDAVIEEARARLLSDASSRADQDTLAAVLSALDSDDEDTARTLLESSDSGAITAALELLPSAARSTLPGVSTSLTWKFEIVEPGRVKGIYKSPDEKMIGKVVKAMGLAAETAVGGIKVTKVRTIAVKMVKEE